ncbi:MAG: hypothetical protein EPO11_09060, partial [Gammaproteobacteria bacterium]
MLRQEQHFMPELNPERIKELLEKSYPKIESAAGKDIVVCLGLTGSGKSTAIAYMLGAPLEKEEGIQGYNIVLKDHPDYPKIGTSSTSETFFPQTYVNKLSHFTFCDCPGFKDNRSPEEQLMVNINSRLPPRLARTTKIMVTIDINSLLTTRADSLRNLCEILGQFIKDSAKIKKSIFFVVTKAEKVNEDKFFDQIEEIIKRDTET